MAITSGFYNSIDGDRKYYASDLNSFLEGLVSGGVFQGVGNGLAVKAESGMTVQVLTGKLVDSHGRWLKNDATINLTLEPSEITLARYDAIVACANASTSVRDGDIYVKKGVAGTNPSKPTMIRNADKEECCLAYIYVGKNVTGITQSAIEDTRADASLCGWVVSLIKELDLGDAQAQYAAAFYEWFNSIKDVIASSTLIRSYHSAYTTVTDDETDISINLSQFNRNLDILQVFINGLKLVPDVDYTLISNEKISLTKPVCSGTQIEFQIFKSIDGSEAETVVQQVTTLQQQVAALQQQVDALT